MDEDRDRWIPGTADPRYWAGLGPRRPTRARSSDGMANPAVAVIGEALVDLAAEGTARAGGSPLNVAVSLARLGQPTALLARFGPDAFGRLLRDHATRSGVDLRWAVAGAEPSTVARVHLDEHGAARYEFTVEDTADFGWRSGELVLPPDVRALHFGSLASWLPPGEAVIARAVSELHGSGQVLISYDPNVRPALQPDVDLARSRVESAVRHAHVVKASADDVRHLYGAARVESIACRWLELGPQLVVITRGGDGVLAVTGDGALSRPARRVDVTDTVGAGDAFSSGLVDALLRRRVTPGAPLPSGQLADALDEAALVAALTCARAGADPPTRTEIAAETTRQQG